MIRLAFGSNSCISISTWLQHSMRQPPSRHADGGCATLAIAGTTPHMLPMPPLSFCAWHQRHLATAATR
jgi:hypothetical protein